MAIAGWLQLRYLGAYTVRYHFVICGFPLAETEKARLAFLLGRAPKVDHLELF